MTVLDNRLSELPGTGTHFRLKVAGKRIAYCFIRKNASSAFKTLFKEFSPFCRDTTDNETLYAAMREHHSIKKTNPLVDFDHSIFVYRHPIARIVSLFKNKFISRQNNARIFVNYRLVTGCDPELATFRDFVFNYLRSDFPVIDRHALPQAHHLRPAVYTDAIEISNLYNHMCSILGDQIAERHFQAKINSSSEFCSVDVSGAYTIKADDLHQSLLEKKLMPSDLSLLDADIKQRLEDLYAIDLDLWRRLGGRSRQLVTTTPEVQISIKATQAHQALCRATAKSCQKMIREEPFEIPGNSAVQAVNGTTIRHSSAIQSECDKPVSGPAVT